MNKLIIALTYSLFLIGCDRTADVSETTPQSPAQPEQRTAIEFKEKAVGSVVPSENAHALWRESEDVVFVSVREREEWDEYHIPGAVWIPHSELKEKNEVAWATLERLAKTHRYVLTYCGAGHRSGFVAAQARERGLSNVHNLDGISFWKEKFPIVLGEKRSPDREPKMVHLEEAYYYYTAGFDDVDFIDVREPESIAMSGGNIIKGAKVIPLSEFVKNLNVIDCQKDNVFICEGTFDGGECSASPAAGKIAIDRLGCKAGHMKYMIEGHGAWEAAGYPIEPYKG